MKIAYIVPALVNRGPVIVVKELVNQMLKAGNECWVFYFDGMTELTFPCPTIRVHFFEKIEFDRFDIVHTNGLRPDIYVYFHRSSCDKARFLTTIHSYVLRDLTSQYNKLVAFVFGNLWMRLLKRHDLIVSLSEDAMKYYCKWFDKSHLTYAYNTRELSLNAILTSEEKKQILDFKGECILIGVNALLSPIKGIDLLIRSLEVLPEYKLFIVGDGKSRKYLCDLVEKCKLGNRVMFVGYKRDAYRYLSYYDIFAMPSRSEGFPLALLEAAAIKVPTVCSNIPIFKEIFNSTEVAFFEPENIDDLARAIMNAKYNLEMADLMNRRYLSMYSPAVFAERYIDIYMSLMK
ncbi:MULTISPECIES: glycosyltransferase family 4 protein [Bacteroides]|jgi:glycosyltransferase involved in cell wall biosynthesis|uniref:glycosyltransferase family 4 protein n=1 Tax=Bacteroides TaxID=816 RepID=UPI000515D1E0|nr:MULTISPECIES: glycosyltransferase family 4 protein [Bacteroides]MCM0236493.1 glycosyltransferase family 4 protein [Bacteroides fragilis]MCM0364794.1 glycosyltransferase family 4 protein [Bacteroides fragilis]MCZ2670741.1 glycosyltransferase family 4 protein [Bacteroides fragilis]MDA1490951.1 glycosyltransferase family 4 protein [Bacteroides fragilis]MDV6204549.1 glycosyltransferase family 4 protein [Bacteroides hominis (ex Liu et al. 2022)]